MPILMPQCLGKERRETNYSYLIASLKGIFNLGPYGFLDQKLMKQNGYFSYIFTCTDQAEMLRS